ncbi:MAG: VanW family protein [Patescibacteria group bacterium]
MKKVHAALLIALTILLAGLFTTTMFAMNAHAAYKGRVAQNIFVAGINLSGMDALAATSTLQKAYDAMISSGLPVVVGDDTKTIDLFSSNGSDVAYNLVDWDPSAAAQEALTVGHNSNPAIDSILTLYFQLFGQKSFAATVIVNEDRLKEAIAAAFPDAQTQATATDFDVSLPRGKDPVITVTEGTNGQTLNFGSTMTSIAADAKDLALKPVSVATMPVTPYMTASDATSLIPLASAAITAAPYTIAGTDASGEPQTWTVSTRTIADWIFPTEDMDQGLVIGLEPEKMVDFLTELHETIDISAQNARFTLDGGKVNEFQGSKNGTVVDDDAFFAAFEAALGTATSDDAPIVIATRTEMPSISTEDANGLGISEIVGEATTTFSHPTANRKANIKHGAEKLNGILIAPGETVSLLEHLRPFTLDDGYFSELVIKGDEIKPEVGGGLCQLGTTAFRAVMHAGLEVVERRNHSLAISYYNDVTNDNPGTDATLYDPAPDFKFKNDMPTYTLLVTSFDDELNAVTFTFWGTKDGRSGSYNPPTVLSRTSMGAKVVKETDTLAPGVEQCQNGFPGAVATFDYTVLYADGTTKVTPYLSTYRALPETCLVGKATSTTAPTDEVISQ